MNKSELIDSVASTADISRAEAEKAINAVVESITKELAAGSSVVLVGFGTFQVSSRSARKGRNPQTGAEIEIAAAKLPVFKAGTKLKSAVNS